MSRRQTIEALDKMQQDINESELPFGGKVVVFGGDFRQVLLVVPKASRQKTIDTSLIKSYLWPTLEKIKLTDNMRAQLDPAFSDYLLQAGNGTEQIVTDNTINLPTTMIIAYIDDMTSLTALIDAIFLNRRNCNLPTCGLTRFNNAHPWFKSCHLTHLRWSLLDPRYPPLPFPLENLLYYITQN